MKKIYFVLTICVMFSVTFTHAQFEGILSMKITSYDNEKAEEMKYTVSMKKNLLAFELKGNEEISGKFIIRGDKKVMWVLNDEDKTYLEFPLKEDDTDQIEAKPQKLKANGRKTGKKQTILGYQCDEWVIEDGEEITTIWGTSKLGNLYQELVKTIGKTVKTSGEDSKKKWEHIIENMNLFPLKVEVHKRGKITEMQEVTKIEKKLLPERTFAVPSGYQKQSFDFDIDEMMQREEDEE